MFAARCLCGAVTWQVAAPVPPMFHCHCSRCRKAHGAGFATYVVVPERDLMLGGREHVGRWCPPGGDERCFCRRCGSVVPYAFAHDVFAPAGNFVGDPGARPGSHIFVGSRAPWYELDDRLPRHAGYPPGTSGGAVSLPDPAPLDPPGLPRGSCLCGEIAFVLTDLPQKRRYCHCSRCRYGCSAAHAANLTTTFDGVRFTRGEAGLVSYQVPDARHFTQVFCRTCGSLMPRRDPARGIAVVPMGALDDDPGVPVTAHIFVGSKAPWFDIADDLPQHVAYPPA